MIMFDFSQVNNLPTIQTTHHPVSCAYYIKQIMTGLEGNRQIYLPREIQDRLPKSFY